MATTNKWTDVGAVSLVIAGDASSPTLKNKTNSTYTLSNEIDPGAGSLDQMVTYRLKLKATTPTKGLVAKCWYVLDTGDSGNYDVTDGTNTPDRAPDFVFYGYAVTTQQYLQSVPAMVVRPPHPHKVLLQNVSGATTSNTDDENQLHESTYNDSQA
jgi:hypothetical protein